MELINLLEGNSRLKIPVAIKSNSGLKTEIDYLIDTGCSTTMIDIELAKLFGERLIENLTVNLGNKQYLAQAYKINSITLGSLEIKNVFALAVRMK